MALTTTNRLVNELGGYSRRWRLIALCLAAVPVLIGAAWAVFPFLQERNLGYRVWHFSCLLGSLFAGFGIVCWFAERSRGMRAPSWIALLSLVCMGGIAITLRLFGDFYWAFQRGYFLD